MWVMIENGPVIDLAQTSEVSKTSEVSGYHPHCITTQYDLGVFGDDAVEFLEAFAKRFEVDMTGFELPKHFPGEAIDLLGFFYNLLIKRHPKPMPEFVPVTIGDLVRAVDCHKWLL